MTQPVRIGAVNYLNTKPLIYELDLLAPEAELILEVPSRLTDHLAARSSRTVAVEPSAGLRALLSRRLPTVEAVAGWAENLPLGDGLSELTAACGALGPDAVVLRELARVTCEGGVIALINPEEPEWFEARGWEVNEVAPATVKPHDRWIDEFFGPPDPPRFLVTKMKER